MKEMIEQETVAEYKKLADLAKGIESALLDLVLATAKADIPDKAKIAVLDWIHRADTFKGLSYFLKPQTEWQGGDSSDAKNFRTFNPHIAR